MPTFHDRDPQPELEALLNGLEEPTRNDCLTLISLMQELTGVQPGVWGGSMVGFGRYKYKYPSGHEGETARLAFAPRKGKITIYLGYYLEQTPELFANLGKHKLGKGCLYIKKVSDVNLDVLRVILQTSLDKVQELYG